MPDVIWLVMAVSVCMFVVGVSMFIVAYRRIPSSTPSGSLHVVEGVKPPTAATSRMLEDFLD